MRDSAYIFKLPFIRTLIFCILIFVLHFFDQLNVLIFFLLGGIYALIETLSSKKQLDIKTGNKFIDFSWIIFLVGTMLFVVLEYVF